MLSQPIFGDNFEQLIRKMKDVGASLEDQDQAIGFDAAFTALLNAVVFNGEAQITEKDRQQLYYLAVNGLSPKQIIILGSAIEVQSIKNPSPDQYSDSLQEDVRRERADHMARHRSAREYQIVRSFRALLDENKDKAK